MKGFSAKIVNCSKEHLTRKEMLMYSDTTGTTLIDDMIDGDNGFVIKPDFWAEIEVNNENAKDGQSKNYTNFIVHDENTDTMYRTGSQSFIDAFLNIWEIMVTDCPEDEKEDFEIKIFAMKSKNYNGKDFYTCAVI